MRIKRPPTLERVLGKEMHCSRRRIKVGDRHMDPVTDTQMREFMIQNHVDKLKWIEERQDCDNFALYFRSDAKRWFAKRGINAMVGEIWTYPTKDRVGHAFNFSVKPDNHVTYWEPQDDSLTFLTARVNFVVIQ